MKTAVKFDGRRRRTVRYTQQFMVATFRPAIAMRYCLAAQQDEKNGFPFTAAMGWRKAAELFVPITSMSDRCWVEWERIMRLPRQLAGPIGASNAVQSSSPTSDSCDRGSMGLAAVAVFSNTPPVISGFCHNVSRGASGNEADDPGVPTQAKYPLPSADVTGADRTEFWMQANPARRRKICG